MQDQTSSQGWSSWCTLALLLPHARGWVGLCDAQQPTNANSQWLLSTRSLPALGWAPISRRQPPPALSCWFPSVLSLPLSPGLGPLPPSLRTQH